jgi:hypothetical protein
MASRWKFLSRLVPGRKRKRDDRTSKEAKPDVLAIASPSETPAEEGFNSLDQLNGAAEVRGSSLTSASADTAAMNESEGEVHDAAEGVEADAAAVGGGISSNQTDGVVAAAPDAAEFEPAVDGKAHEQRSRNKKVKTEGGVAQFSRVTEIISDATMNLDDEIRLLRGQLASKLRMQNAQLKKMLERFER